MNKSTTFWVLIFLVILLGSCKSYESGFLSPYYSTSDIKLDLAALNKNKEVLKQETEQVVSNIIVDIENDRSIHAVEINNLLENVSRHFELDKAYQYITSQTNNDSLKKTALEQLWKSASFYNTELQQEKTIRRIINSGDDANHIQKRTLAHSQKFLWNRRNMKLFEDKSEPIQKKSKYTFRHQKLQDKFFNAGYNVGGFGSKVFGHLIACFHGKHKPEENVRRIMPYLNKWDIVCQKANHHLTDKFIPGYFGHVGIYLGDSIFVEAVQKGVIYTAPEDFLVGNDFIIIRPKEIANNEEIKMEQRLRAQVGKKYDFNFNIESPNKIVCTELIFLIYDQVDWKTYKVAGRYTIAPDSLVETALNNEMLNIPLYFNEKEMIEKPEHGYIEYLLRQK